MAKGRSSGSAGASRTATANIKSGLATPLSDAAQEREAAGIAEDAPTVARLQTQASARRINLENQRQIAIDAGNARGVRESNAAIRGQSAIDARAIYIKDQGGRVVATALQTAGRSTPAQLSRSEKSGLAQNLRGQYSTDQLKAGRTLLRERARNSTRIRQVELAAEHKGMAAIVSNAIRRNP